MPRVQHRTREPRRLWITPILLLADIFTVLIRPLLTAITSMGGTVSTILRSSLPLRMRRRFTKRKKPRLAAREQDNDFVYMCKAKWTLDVIISSFK
jgi:hypothetical protein